MVINLIMGVTDEENLEEAYADLMYDENVETVKKYLESDEEEIEIHFISKYFNEDLMGGLYKYAFRFIAIEGKKDNSSVDELYRMYLRDKCKQDTLENKARYILFLMNDWCYGTQDEHWGSLESAYYIACSKGKPLYVNSNQWYFEFYIPTDLLEFALGDPSRKLFKIRDISRRDIEFFVLQEFIKSYYLEKVRGKVENTSDELRNIMDYMAMYKGRDMSVSN